MTIANINFYIVLKEIFKEKGWRYLNCRKTLSQLTKNQRMKLAKELEKINHEILKAESKKMGLRIANNLFKIAIVSANESLGLGKSRIERLLEAINLKMSKLENDEEFWLLTEEKCKNILTEKVYSEYFTDEPFSI